MPTTARRESRRANATLTGHPAATLPSRHSGRRLIGAAQLVQPRGRPRLTRRRRRLHPLQLRDPPDQRRLIGTRIHRNELGRSNIVSMLDQGYDKSHVMAPPLVYNMRRTRMTTRHAVIDSPLGELTVVADGGALTGLYFRSHWFRPAA